MPSVSSKVKNIKFSGAILCFTNVAAAFTTIRKFSSLGSIYYDKKNLLSWLLVSNEVPGEHLSYGIEFCGSNLLKLHNIREYT